MDGLCKRNEQMSVKRDRKMQCLFHRVEIFMSLDLAAFCSNVIHNEAFNLQKMEVTIFANVLLLFKHCSTRFWCGSPEHCTSIHLKKRGDGTRDSVVVLWVTKAMYVSKPPDYISWQLDELLCLPLLVSGYADSSSVVRPGFDTCLSWIEVNEALFVLLIKPPRNVQQLFFPEIISSAYKSKTFPLDGCH